MAAFDYVSIRDTVSIPLLRDVDESKTGALLVAGAATGPAYDPQPAADVSHPIIAFRGSFDKSDIVGVTVQVDDVVFLVSPEGLTITPEMPDRIVVGGTEYHIIRIKTIGGSVTTLLWKVYARK